MLPNKIIYEIIEIICNQIFLKAIKGHCHEITSKKYHPKRHIDTLRLWNRHFHNYFERYFINKFININNNYKINIINNNYLLLLFYLEKQELNENFYNFKNIFLFFINKKTKSLCFWEIIILNSFFLPQNPNEEYFYYSDFFINLGCFKFFVLFQPNNKIYYSKNCEYENNWYLKIKKSKDNNSWYYFCDDCKFYEHIVSYNTYKKHKLDDEQKSFYKFSKRRRRF